MRVFEFHFNPKTKEDLIFDSFCYEPENTYERKLGSLYLAGELKNTLSQNHKFLDHLASFIKKEYYSGLFKSAPDSALKDTLKKSNEFLEEIAKKGDVSWLGKLNLAVLNFKKFDFNFTKVGEMKILLLRQGQIIDIGKNLDFSEIEPYPLKIFGNILSGKLAENDLVLIMTKEIFSVFSANFGSAGKNSEKEVSHPENILGKIAGLTLSEEIIKSLNEKTMREIFRIREKELLKISGLCLLCHLTKDDWLERQKPKTLTFEKGFERFSLYRTLFLPLIKFYRFVLSKLRGLLSFLKRKVKLPKKKAPEKAVKKEGAGWKIPIASRMLDISGVVPPAIKLKIKKPKINLSVKARKNIAPILILVLILFSGFFIFQKQGENKLKEYQKSIASVQQDITQAQNFIVLKEEKKAFDLLKKGLENIIPLTEKDSPVKEEARGLQNVIEENLAELSKLEKISEPELFFEFNPQEFVPQKIIYFKGDLYLYNPFVQNIVKINSQKQKSVLEINQTFNEAAALNNSLLFFKKPNSISILKNNIFGEPLLLNNPYPDFTPDKIAVYRENLYVFDQEKGEIIKYSRPLAQGKNQPQIWLGVENQKAFEGISMAIDSSIWILNKDNSISQYYLGALKETLSPYFFPYPKDLSKINVSSDYIYLLEPAQKRIVILNKKGEIIRQFQSDKFGNLKGFALSENGKTIWLLNGLKIYKINL